MTLPFHTTSNPGHAKGWDPLMCAAEAGDIDTLVELLTDGYNIFDINVRDYNGCTPLALAAGKGHTAVVERLLEHDANPNLSDLDHITPLWKAARYGHTSVVKLLLASTKLLDVNTRPAYLHKYKSDTPLSIALKEGHQEIAELLSRTNGINPSLITNLPNGYDRAVISILGLAIHCAFEDVALFLLHICDLRHDVQHDFDDRTHDDDGAKDGIEPPSKLLVFAVAAGCSRVIEELLTKHGADINALHEYFAREERRWFTDSPLIAASRRGDLNTVCSLLNMDEIRPGVSSKGGDTALTAAARGGFLDVVKTLITDGGIDVNSKDGRGCTALSLAAESGSEGVVNELLATGVADLNAQDDVGRTALICATDPEAGYGPGGWQLYEGAVRRLLAHSQITVNDREEIFDRTALACAAKNGALGLVKALLEHPQIDPTAGSGYSSPLAEAAENGHADVARLLINIGQVDVNTVLTRLGARTVLMLLAEDGRVENESVVQVLLSTAGVDVNFQSGNGRTALMLAASGRAVGIVKLILASGAGPNIQDASGCTALCYAHDVEITKALLEEPGIEPDLPDHQGRTPLSLAAQRCEIERVDALLATNAVDPNARDILGRTPLLWLFNGDGLKDSWKKEERKAVLRQLLKIPAVDPNAEDQNGLNPLLLAIRSDQGHEYVKVLLSRLDLDVDRPRVVDAAKENGNMVTMALLRIGCASESIESVRPHWSQVDIPIEEGSCRSEYSIFEETRRKTRRRRHAPRSWSQGSGSASDEPDYDRHGRLTQNLQRRLGMSVLREYTLCLGEQQAYVGQGLERTPSLCSACLDIDLDSSFQRRHTQYKGLVIADLDRVDETLEKRSCPLCRLFASVYPRTSLGEDHKLVSFSTTQSWLCHAKMVRWNDFRFKRFFDTMLLAVVAADLLTSDKGDLARARKRRNGSPSRREKDVVEAAFSSGLIGRLGRNGPYQGALTIPRLPIEISDWHVARGWITLCREHHSGECNPRKAASVPHFLLIECSTRQIVEQKGSQTDGPPPYVALSYVWGQSAGSQQPLRRHKQQEGLDGNGEAKVEPAIEDAIHVTLKLGYSHLWVDRYCIVQTGDEAIKQEQLRNMHLVYANAEVTLIAAAGKDSSAGLPGVPGRPRNQQPGALINNHALVCIPPDPSFHIRSRSTWATRGWTYQEGLLARRRLYFSEYEMSYECRHMLCREAIRLPVGLEQRISGHKPRHMEPFWMYQPYKLPGMDSSQTGIHVFDLLEAYSRRKLSLPSDALNAMLGIFNLLAQHKKRPIYHICGVPILRLSGHQDPETYESSAPSDNGDNSDATAVGLCGFLDGLCWRLKEPAHRRPEFPSWSWTGWEGIVHSISKDSTAIKQTNGFAIDVSIIPGNQNGGIAVPWSRCYSQLGTANDSNPDIRSGQSHVLEITASAVTVKLHRGEYDGRPDTWIGTVCAGHGVWQGEFFLTSKDVPVSSLLQESWTGIVLGNSESQRYSQLHDTTVVVIQEQSHQQGRGWGNVQDHRYCERVGLLRLLHCTLEASILDQRTWRLQ